MTDSYLATLWRKACLALYGDRCFVCGGEVSGVHHIVRRRRRLLRWDVLNGMPLCKSCHEKAHKVNGWERDYLTPEERMYLDERALIDIKTWLQRKGLTMDEFEKAEAEELKAIIRRGE